MRDHRWRPFDELPKMNALCCAATQILTVTIHTLRRSASRAFQTRRNTRMPTSSYEDQCTQLRPRLRHPQRAQYGAPQLPNRAKDRPLRPRRAAPVTVFSLVQTLRPNPARKLRCFRVTAMVASRAYIRPGGVWSWKTVSSLTSILLQF